MRLTVFLMAMLTVSCGHQPTGACVRGAGIGATCGDGFTAAQCSMVGGTAFYQGQTCQQLGLAKATNGRSKFVLQISSTPDGAQIQIDAAIVGVTPLNLSVASGKHEISITKSGYSDWTRTLDVNVNTTRVEAVLESQPVQ
jgi:hypothetical protein